MPTTGTTIKRYVSAIESLDQKEIHPNVVNIQNNHGLVDLMSALGRYKPSKMYEYESFTNDALWKEAVVSSITGSPVGEQVVVNLTTPTSGGRRNNDSVMMANGKVAHVMSVTPGSNDAITLKSVDGTWLSVANSDKLKFLSNAVGEAAVGRENLFIGLTHYFNLIQMFDENHSESDVQRLSKVEVPSTGNWTVKEYAEKFMKLKIEVNTAFISGQISAARLKTASPALTDPDGGGQIQYTRGLKQYIDSYGVTDDVASMGTWALADLAEIIDLFVANKSGKRYDLWGSVKAIGEIDDTLKNLGSGGVTSARMNVDGSEINYMVDKFRYRGFDFQKSEMPILSQPDLYGGTIYEKIIFYLPQGKVKTTDSEGYTTDEPCIQARYKPQPGNIAKDGSANTGNAIWAEIHSGAYSPVNPNGRTRKAIVDFVTHQGLEVLGAQHFGYQKVIA